MSDIDFQIVDVENELEKQREDPTRPDPTFFGKTSKFGCFMSIIYFLLGISLLRLVGELLSFGLHLIY
jgi:hypothetical protein